MSLVLQQEAVECGLACLVMILKAYGSNISLDSLRRKFNISLRGTSVAELVRIANYLKLDATVYLLKADQLTSINRPTILFWNNNHYVVLEKIDKRKGYHILDPAMGDTWLNSLQLNQHYSEYAISFKPQKDYRPLKESHLSSFKEITRGVPKLFSYFWCVTIFSLLLHMLLLLFPCYIQQLIDPAFFQSNLSDTIQMSVFVLLLFKLCEAALHLVRGITIGKAEKIFTEYLSHKILKHLFYLPLSFFEKHSQGSIYSRFNSIEKTREILSRGFAEGLVDGLFSVLILIIIYIYNFKIGFIVSTLTFIYLFANYLIAMKAKSHNQVQIKERSKETSFLLECLRGIIPIKIFSKEKHSIKKWLNLHKKHLSTAHKIHFWQSLLDSFRIFVFGLQIALIILVSLSLIYKKEITLGMLYALLFYINSLTKNISSLTSKWFDIKMLSTHAEYLSNILTYQTESSEKKNQLTYSHVSSIVIENLSFRYHKNEPWIIKNASFSIQAGHCVIFYGASGHGKSTLLKILMGLLRPCSGEILINNLALQDKNLFSYREKIAAVMQDDELFSGTIYENISFFDYSIDSNRAKECAKLAGMADEIEAMPMGYHSYIGDMGIAISGGQKQRILLARALYCKPSILFLDEAFSNLDIHMERELTTTLKKLGLTLIMITHRHESLSLADKVIHIFR